MNSIALIQLVSEQTMQNVLPILRLRPASVFHLATLRTASRTEHILNAAKTAGITPAPENIRLSNMPSIPETHRAVTRAINFAREEGLTPVVNFTGGTKLMSIGAYLAALQANPPVPTIYVDTDDERFEDGGTAPGLPELLENDMSLTPIRPALTLDVVATANGVEHITKGRDWHPYLHLAEYLFAHPAAEIATHEAVSKIAFDLPNNGPKSPEKWLELLDREFDLPDQVACLAAKCGLISLTSTGKCKLPDATRAEIKKLRKARAEKKYVNNYDQQRIAATDPIEFAISFLTGGWWEVIMADRLARTGAFTDVRWSVAMRLPGGTELEEDVLALDGVRAVCVSCKRGGSGARLIAHLEELDARARHLGGHFTRKFLAVYRPIKGKTGAGLTKRAQELGIYILTPENISTASSSVH